MPQTGYYRFPSIHGDTIVFTCEDDLWSVPASGGLARRLTTGAGESYSPWISPDGRWIAFIAREEGPPEVHVMPVEGGPPVRRTFLGSTLARVAGWSRDGREILFASNAQAPMMRMIRLFAVPRDGGPARLLPYGIARAISFGPRRGVVLGRHGADPARWKRYRGGTVGQIWIDPRDSGRFHRLIETGGNLACPMWIGSRIYFLSDHEGIGNLYSCDLDGRDLRRHTHHREYYARNASTDGRRIVYHCGADIWIYDPEADESRRVEIAIASPRPQRHRRFVEATKNWEDYHPDPKGRAVAIVTRGKLYTMENWSGAVTIHTLAQGVRHRLARWLDDRRLIAITDEHGEEELVILRAVRPQPPRYLRGLPIGCAHELVPDPRGNRVAILNHRNELLLVDLRSRRVRVVDRSEHGPIAGVAWSPDGRWIAYGFPDGPRTSAIRIAPADGGKPRTITRPVLRDISPAFDPAGNFLYYLSVREFDPVYDQTHFELAFPRGMRPCLIPLRRDIRSPFDTDPPPKPKKFRIDFDGIEDRAIPFPVPEGRYGQIAGIRGGALFTSLPVAGALRRSWVPGTPPPHATLDVWRFSDRRRQTLVEGVSSFRLSGDSKTIYYRAGDRLRAIPPDHKPDPKEDSAPPSRRSGWIALDRIRVEVDPAAEWRQMLQDAWRAMRDHFWVEDLSGVDWARVRRRYLPLVERVATRSEFSDLMWEMQGELGTSHCYELGGDYRTPPPYDVGFLAAHFAYDPRRRGYRIERIVRGDPGEPEASSPLLSPGANIKEGDVIVAINGRPLSKRFSPQEALVALAGQEIRLTLSNGRSATVRALASETLARYRDWVNANRAHVHRRTRGRVGYVHIPDMGAPGYSEFHRQFLHELDRPGLIVDVRYNGGGHVSQLLLEKLARRRLAYVKRRWGAPEPYPEDAPCGPMVCLTNEEAGSDGDIFSHCWKMLRLGPLVGRRTWGGVIGIWPRHMLVDGSFTTQPEYSFWFLDAGFGIENHGTEPNVDVDIAPHDFVAGRDPQLDRAIEVALGLLRDSPPRAPTFEPRPRLTLPLLPNGRPKPARQRTRPTAPARR